MKKKPDIVYSPDYSKPLEESGWNELIKGYLDNCSYDCDSESAFKGIFRPRDHGKSALSKLKWDDIKDRDIKIADTSATLPGSSTTAATSSASGVSPIKVTLDELEGLAHIFPVEEKVDYRIDETTKLKKVKGGSSTREAKATVAPIATVGSDVGSW